jgi:hypothetical protein
LEAPDKAAAATVVVAKAAAAMVAVAKAAAATVAVVMAAAATAAVVKAAAVVVAKEAIETRSKEIVIQDKSAEGIVTPGNGAEAQEQVAEEEPVVVLNQQ